jgi:hypothetical protein
VVEETIDLEALKREKESLQAQLLAKEPEDKELLAFARTRHSYYAERDLAQNRLTEITNFLGLYGDSNL